MRSVGHDARFRCCVSLSVGAREKTRHLENESPERAKRAQHERSNGNQNGDQQLARRTIHVQVREFVCETFVVLTFEGGLRRAAAVCRALRSQDDGDCDHCHVHRQRCERPDGSLPCRNSWRRRDSASPDAFTFGGGRLVVVRGLCSRRARLRVRSL
eukprot:198988-Pleurochrysis_carterae.AAC.1